MSLEVGDVVVHYPAADAGTGLAFALYDARKRHFLPSLESPYTPEATVAALLTSIAQLAKVDATALITYLLGHATVSVTVSSGGLQCTPTPNSAGVATAAPVAPVPLVGMLS
jgi:hypothetical protein